MGMELVDGLVLQPCKPCELSFELEWPYMLRRAMYQDIKGFVSMRLR
jgi:hypothetical protein